MRAAYWELGPQREGLSDKRQRQRRDAAIAGDAAQSTEEGKEITWLLPSFHLPVSHQCPPLAQTSENQDVKGA